MLFVLLLRLPFVDSLMEAVMSGAEKLKGVATTVSGTVSACRKALAALVTGAIAFSTDIGVVLKAVLHGLYQRVSDLDVGKPDLERGTITQRRSWLLILHSFVYAPVSKALKPNCSLLRASQLSLL